VPLLNVLEVVHFVHQVGNQQAVVEVRQHGGVLARQHDVRLVGLITGKGSFQASERSGTKLSITFTHVGSHQGQPYRIRHNQQSSVSNVLRAFASDYLELRATSNKV
jgi:hypothetical protein